MIVSHKHRFIYIATRKTASTSTSLLLSQYCGKGDVLTNIRSTPVSRKYRYRPRDREGLGLKHHVTAREILDRVGADVFWSYTKVGNIRNPWDRVVSQLYSDKRQKYGVKQYLRVLQPYMLMPCFEQCCVNNRLCLDVVLRYESLVEDIHLVCAKLNLPLPKSIPQAKVDMRVPKIDYRKYYDRHSRMVVAKRYRQDITAFGYSFK